MKNKIVTFLLTLLVIILSLIIGIVAVYIYITITSDTISPVYEFVGESYSSEEVAEEKTGYISSGENLLDKVKILFNIEGQSTQSYNYSAQSSESNYYYKQLNNEEKKIYNGLQENKENMISGTYTINYGNTFSDLLSTETGSDLLGDYYQAAVEAFTHDNVDMFYLNVNKMYLNIETTKRLGKSTYNVYISPKANRDYYADGFSSKEQVETSINKIEQIRDDLVSTLSGNTYNDIVKIHDYLVNNIEYDKTYDSFGAYNIYGALIKNSAVCEGYAKAFKYLLNYAGIECEIIQGKATNSSGETESHAWNAVYLNDKWYLVDVTWDDPIIIGGGPLTIRNKHKYLLKGAETFNKDHQEEYQFTENGKKFVYPEISMYDYK